MPNTSKQPSERQDTTFKSFGPNFFSRILKEEREGQNDTSDVDLQETYCVELSARGLGMNGIVFIVLRVYSDLGATDFPDAEDAGKDEQTIVGSATLSVTETSFRNKDRSCQIEQLKVSTGNALNDVVTLTAILRRIRFLCIDIEVDHLTIVPPDGSCWFSGILKPAGFKICRCVHHAYVGVGIQLCMVLPSPATISEGHPQAPTSSGVVWTAPKNVRPASKIAEKSGPSAKKEYCSHWIMHGECEYTQMGCKYKHEIPLDEETRQRIGLLNIPGWFRDSPKYDEFLQHVNQAAAQKSTAESSRRGLARSGIAEAKTARLWPSSATKIDNVKAANAAAGRRPDRGIYRPPRAKASSRGSGIGAATGESSKVKDKDLDSDVEEPSNSQAKSGGAGIPASNAGSGPIQ